MNKTGTLNTKSVTASMLATDSPILPHKVNGSYTQQVRPEINQLENRSPKERGQKKNGIMCEKFPSGGPPPPSLEIFTFFYRVFAIL